MKFKWARCVCCSNYFTNSSLLVAFRRVCRSDNDPCRLELEIVDLRGQEPWSGIMVICVDCLDLFRKARGLDVLMKRCKEKAMIEPQMEDIPYDRPPDDPPETQTTIGEWANATFGGSGDPLSSRHCIRLLEEVVELCLAAGATPSDIYLAIAHENRRGIKYSDWHSSNPDIAKVPEEMADCEIVLRVLAHRRDVDLQAEVDKKMKINRSRKWNLNNDGTGYHVKEGEK